MTSEAAGAASEKSLCIGQVASGKIAGVGQALLPSLHAPEDRLNKLLANANCRYRKQRAGLRVTYNDLDAKIGERIRSQRKRMGLSQKELASRLDIVFQQLQKHENGTSRVPASRLYEISRALNTPISVFFDVDSRESYRSALPVPDVSAIVGAQKSKLAKQALQLITAFVQIKDEDARADIVSLVARLSRSKARR
ncbi:helix-turn-helix domain-containing protein [Bradyrhizobium sp. IAR9]|uniref:helix-turn-helix domain-containing protein n=1 Tax=Bradyrhizobium sp. IAR9 TaxID=2663841 RepID=UPI00390CC612